MTFDLVDTISMHFYERSGAKQKEMFEISDLRRRENSVRRFVPQWEGGGTLIFSYIRRLWLFFIFYFFFGGGGVQDIEFQYF